VFKARKVRRILKNIEAVREEFCFDSFTLEDRINRLYHNVGKQLATYIA
jgi:hypothetical protein